MVNKAESNINVLKAYKEMLKAKCKSKSNNVCGDEKFLKYIIMVAHHYACN